MIMTAKIFMILGCLNAAFAVVMGAFGAHALRDKLMPDLMNVYQTAVQYHFFHGLGLIAAALAMPRISSATAAWAGWIMFAGLILFCGSLYGLSLGGWRWLGAITPVGGLAFIASWLLLAFAAFRA